MPFRWCCYSSSSCRRSRELPTAATTTSLTGAYGYRNRATVVTDTSGAKASTYIGAYPSATRPAGWYGALGRLYNDAGTLVLDSGYVYNAIPGTGLQNWTAYWTVRDTYYSYGVSKSWTGSEYHGHATMTSPYQSY